jgi:hypothetical protein
LELYDLKADPGEATDLAATHPAEVAKADILMERSRTEWLPGGEAGPRRKSP